MEYTCPKVRVLFYEILDIPFYLRNSAILHILIYLCKIHVDRGSNLTFLRELQAELGVESRCECGLLSLAYALSSCTEWLSHCHAS